jgi:predicted DNA-binding protein
MPTHSRPSRAAADYAERGGKRGPLGKQDLAKLLTLAEFFEDRPCDELDHHAWNDFVEEELEGRSGETVRRWFAMFRTPVRRALQQCGSRFANSICRRPAKAAPFFLEEDAADELHACYAPHARPIISMLGVRITPGMRQRLAALAEETGRSLAQQTEFLLEQAMAGIDAVGRLEQIEQELDTLIGGTARSGKNLAKGAGRDA